MTFKNSVTTAAGIMVGVGQIPLGIQYAHLPFALPLWWNSAQFPIWLIGTIGGVLLGAAAKGIDEHSSQQQITAASAQKEAEVLVKTADAVAPVEKVEVVKGVIDPRADLHGGK